MNTHPDAFLTLVVHGEAKKGKTRLGSTCPTPILFLDAEAGGMRFVPGRKVTWDPQREPIPDTTNADIVRVSLSSPAVLEAVLNTIARGDHPFVSVVLDSLTEYQERIKREIGSFIDQQGWGKILNDVTDLIMNLREAVEKQPQMLCFLLITGTELRDGKYRPLLQGAMKNKLSYKLDGTGFIFTQRDTAGVMRRGLRIEGDNLTDAGNRFPGDDWPEVIWDPNINNIIREMNDRVLAFEKEQ